jgi:hypothetical protein
MILDTHDRLDERRRRSQSMHTRTRFICIAGISTGVLFLITFYGFYRLAETAHEHTYRQQVQGWMQRVETSSTHLSTAVTNSSIDRIAVQEEFTTIITLQKEVTVIIPPARYTKAHEQLLSALHTYRLALDAFNRSQFSSGRTYLDISGSMFTRFATLIQE